MKKRVMLRSDTKLLPEAEDKLSDRFGVMEERLGENKERNREGGHVRVFPLHRGGT